MYLPSIRPCSARLSTGRRSAVSGDLGALSLLHGTGQRTWPCAAWSCPPSLLLRSAFCHPHKPPFGWSKGRSCSTWDTARLGAFLPQSHVARTCAWQTTDTAMPPVPGQPPVPPRARLHMQVWLVHNCSLWIDALGDGSPTLLLPSVNSGPQRGSAKIQNPRKP